MTTRTLTANFDGLSLTLKEQPAEISTGTWLFYRMVKAKNRGRKYYDTVTLRHKESQTTLHC